MKRFLATLFIFLSLNYCCFASEDKLSVAVFDPTSSGTSIDEGTKIAIRELISSTIVNSGIYNLVERSLLEKVMQEQQFSNSGMVSENDATEIGKLAGANKIVLSVVTLTGGRNMLSIKMIDVQTAQVERQKVKLITSGELLDIVEPMTLETMGLQANYQQSSSSTPLASSQSQQTSQLSSSESDMEALKKFAEISQQASIEQLPKPAAGETILYFAGYQAKNEKRNDIPLVIKFDKKNVGMGTIEDGFLIRLKNVEPGDHKVRIGSQAPIKIDTSNGNYFEFICSEWKYLGVAMFTFVLVRQESINQ